MKMLATMIAAAAATLISGHVLAADSTDRTSMPNNCADRNANCVIQDGPPRGRRGVDSTNTARPAAPAKSDNSSTSATGSSKSGDSRTGSSGSSR